MANKPRLFIGSSAEGLQVAEAIQQGLDFNVETTIWHQGVFGLSEGTLESLTNRCNDFDFAVLVLTPDDLLTSREVEGPGPRDNVIFELGLFMGALGRGRTFIVYNRDQELKLPSDLAGVNAAKFGNRTDGNLQAALGPVCTAIRTQIERVIAQLRPLELSLDFDLSRTGPNTFMIAVQRSNDLPFEAQYTITFPGGTCPCGVPLDWARVTADAPPVIRFKDETIKFPELPHELIVDFRARGLIASDGKSPDGIRIKKTYRIDDTKLTKTGEHRQKTRA